MSVSIENGRILLSGTATVEDAEPLLAALLEHPGHIVDVTGLARAHLAVVQLLHATGRPLAGHTDDAFLRDFALGKLIELNAKQKDTGDAASSL